MRDPKQARGPYQSYRAGAQACSAQVVVGGSSLGAGHASVGQERVPKLWATMGSLTGAPRARAVPLRSKQIHPGMSEPLWEIWWRFSIASSHLKFTEGSIDSSSTAFVALDTKSRGMKFKRNCVELLLAVAKSAISETYHLMLLLYLHRPNRLRHLPTVPRSSMRYASDVQLKRCRHTCQHLQACFADIWM